MKRLNTSAITATNEMPIKSGTLDFLQDAYKEQFANIFTSLYENPQTDTIYIVSGCQNSGSGSVYNIASGVVFVNGELYNFDGATFTLTGLQKAYARIETTQYSVNADPVTFTDGTPRNVHDIRKIVIENTTTSSGLPEYKDFIRVAAPWLVGDTKEVVCNSTYLAANFTSTGATAGLGIGERTGWAIMNGNNGTQNDAGLTVIAYGTGFTTLEATGGSANSVLIAHSHEAGQLGAAGDPADILYSSVGLAAGSANMYKYTKKTGQTNAGAFSTTENGVGKNMQPYVVRLRIQKIA